MKNVCSISNIINDQPIETESMTRTTKFFQRYFSQIIYFTDPFVDIDMTTQQC